MKAGILQARASRDDDGAEREASSTPLVVLASGSPRRRELLALTGLTTEVRATGADETPRPGESGRDLTRRLARHKAESGPAQGAITLSADTTVVDRGALLGKPADADEARQMLERLRGRTHTVVTSIAVRSPEGTVLLDTCESSVPMRHYRDSEISRYLAGDDALDKAGAYAIQDGLFDPVDRAAFTDCFANVMGLPLCHLGRTLRRMGLDLTKEIPAACMAHLQYDCRVYPGILEQGRDA